MGAAILALLVIMPNEHWIMAAFKLSPSPDAERLIMGLRAVAVLGLVGIPLNYAVLKRLLEIVLIRAAPSASARCGPCRASAATMPAANAPAVSTCGRLRRRSLQSGHRAISVPRPPSFESDAMGGLPVLVLRASHS